MADIREKFGLPVDEDFILSDYPTLNHMIQYIGQMSDDISTVAAAVATPVVAAVEQVNESASSLQGQPTPSQSANIT